MDRRPYARTFSGQALLAFGKPETGLLSLNLEP